eukprot:scaffold215714_cov35-Tisochrysis_lutea.AAC.2
MYHRAHLCENWNWTMPACNAASTCGVLLPHDAAIVRSQPSQLSTWRCGLLFLSSIRSEQAVHSVHGCCCALAMDEDRHVRCLVSSRLTADVVSAAATC